MSYIGANPSAADLRLTGAAGIRQATLLQLTVSATAPGTPAEGMVYYNDGTGVISEGLKVYKNGNFVSLDSQEGDADTLQLLQAKDQPAIKFNAAISSTSVVGNTSPVPVPTSTGTIIGTFSVPSTGTEALMSNVDASRVFKYISHSTSDSKSDYWGVPLDIPKAFRGENIVLSFVYRTVTTSTTAMSDGQFKIYIQDKTNGKSVTSTATGLVVAGGNVQVSDRTGIGVGDSILLESGTGNAGVAANGVTEAIVTSIDGSTGAGNITVSESVQMPATAGGRIITKMLTNLPTSALKAAPSTAGSGEMKKIAFVPDSTCAEVYLWWQNTASTGSTKIDSLFYDQLLISSNKFLQIETKDESEYFIGGNFSLYSTSAARIPHIQTATADTGIKYFTFESDGTNGAKFTINEDCIVSADMTFQIASTSTGEYFGWSKNSTQLGTNILSITAADIVAIDDPRGNVYSTVGFTRRMAKGDVLRPHGGNTSGTYQDQADWHCYLTATGIGGEQVVVQSENEVFSEWVEYTPTAGTGFGTLSNVKGWWRRVGDSMQIRGAFTSGTRASADAYISIPTGYRINTSKVVHLGMGDVGYAYRVATSVASFDSGNAFELWVETGGYDKVFLNKASASTTSYNKMNPNTAIDSGDSITFHAEFPILGWRAEFTPLLSMPLVDFDTFSNTYSAKITNGGTAAIASQSESFISSVNRTGAGIVVVTFNSGHFSQAPAISAAGDTNSTTNELLVSVDALSASACTIRTALDSGVETDGDFWLMFQRQGADFKQPPQPTAAVIKPSVAIVCQQQPQGTGGGTIAAGASWKTLVLNAMLGESWFLSANGTTNFTLEPGKYEFDITVPLYNANTNGWVVIGLYDQTNSRFVPGSVTGNAVCDTGTAQTGAYLNSCATVTIGASTEYLLKVTSYVTANVGHAQSSGLAAANIPVTYNSVKIRKLQ